MPSTLPQYQTRILSIPVTTAVEPETQHQYKRLGARGWALKRGYSDSSTSKLKILQESIEKPDLSELFTRVDEECAVIETHSSHSPNSVTEKNNCAVCWTPSRKCSFVADDPNCKQRRRSHAMRSAIAAILVLNLIQVTVTPPIMTYLFAREEWGPIILPKDSPSTLCFAALIVSAAICIGITFYIAFRIVLAHDTGKPVFRKTYLEAGLASLVGAALACWISVWICPLVVHG